MSWNQLVFFFCFLFFFQVHTVSKLYGVQSANYNLLCTYNKTYNNLCIKLLTFLQSFFSVVFLTQLNEQRPSHLVHV